MHRIVVPALLLVAVASCGRNQSGDNADPPSAAPLTTQFNDQGLSSAANIVVPRLESAFAGSYAGLRVHEDVPMLVVYRKPDPRLDAEIRAAVPNVRIEFRDARYTQVEMKEYVKRVMDDDAEHWKSRGVQVVMAGPQVDGSGVSVGTAGEPGDLASQLQERYPAMSFQVTKNGQIVPAPHTGPVPVLPSR